ncbi:MAG: hypothetical protein ISS19_11560 [Bacteroidales bacterium]|nr:hypothetical protein [Bacteroidales bacterium]
MRSLTPQQATGKRVSEFGEANALAGFKNLFESCRTFLPVSLTMLISNYLAGCCKSYQQSVKKWGKVEESGNILFIFTKMT